MSLHNHDVIVYNGLNHEALLTAAILKTELQSNIKTVCCVDVQKIIPRDGVNYIWLGVDPIISPQMQSAHFFTRNVKHIVIKETVDSEPSKSIIQYYKELPSVTEFAIMLHTGQYSEHYNESKIEDTVDKFIDPILVPKFSLMLEALKQCGVNADKYQKLNYIASKFHEKTLSLSDSAWLYQELLIAQETIQFNRPFVTVAECLSQEQNYLEAIKEAKHSLNNSYYILKKERNGQMLKVFYTTYNDFTYHLALKLIRRVHPYFLNISTGLHGLVAYTNLDHIGDFHYNDNLITVR